MKEHKKDVGKILLCNGQTIDISLDTVCDFKNLPFDDNTFYLFVKHLYTPSNIHTFEYSPMDEGGYDYTLDRGEQEGNR